MARSETSLFAPFRALGVVCSSVSPVFAPPVPGRAHFHDGYIFCALDNVVVGYGLGRRRLQLAFCTEPLDDGEITMIAADSHRHFASFVRKATVLVIRNRMVERRLFIGGGGPKLLLSLTDTLVVVDAANSIHIFAVESGEHLVQLDSPESFNITTIAHPHTYVNKILVGAADGRMKLWNVQSGRLVYEFAVSSDEFASPILVLEQSTAIDVIGIGHENGRIQLRNIKFDKLICTFRQSGQVTALAFRTDGNDSMVSANSEGSLAVWDLNERQLLVQLPSAHSARIHFLHFIAGQPFLISAGEDNKIVKWFFRNELSTPEVDTALEGHSEMACSLKFCNEFMIVSASRDGHVRRFNANSAHKCVNLGLAREVRKGDLSKDRFMDVLLNPIVQIEISRGREAVWDNMICRHEQSPLVSTWSTRLGKRGAHLFCHDRFSNDEMLLNAVATSIFISCCGTFALIGYSSGHVDVWNMQSGQWKFALEKEPRKGSSKNEGKKKSGKRQQRTAHDGAVSGLALDLVNRNCVTGSDDGAIHFWQFHSPSAPTLRSRIRAEHPISLFRLDPMNSLLAVGLTNGEVGVLDILCRRIARRLFHYGCMEWPQDARLTALEFSSDGKWLLSSDNKGFLKVWDLISGSLIDVMRCATPCIGLSFGERGDFLATCHEGQRGVYLWANKTMFLASSPSAERPEEELHDIATSSISALPNASATIDEEGEEDDDDEREGEEAKEDESEAEASVVGKSEKGGTVKETRVVLIDEDEEEEGEGASLSTMSLDFSAELPDREQLDPGFYTLSGLAPAHWAPLPQLEHIRRRNKPKEPPKKPIWTPFFLPTVGTLQGFEFDKGAIDESKQKGERTKDEKMEEGEGAEGQGTSVTIAEGNNGREGTSKEKEEEERPIARAKRQDGRTFSAQFNNHSLDSQWTTNKLMSANSDAELCAAFADLKQFGLSALNFQLRSLSGTVQLTRFLAMLTAQMDTRRDFDLCQSWLAAFLNIHHRALWSSRTRGSSSSAEDPNEAEMQTQMESEEHQQQQLALTQQLQRLSQLQQQAHGTLQQLLHDNMTMAEFTKGAL